MAWHPPVTPEVFWGRVDKTGECWLWRGTMHHTGYGVVSIAGKSVKAQRHAWMLAHGPIPPGLMVCHRCDNPRCVRPDHLFLGTALDNIHDAVSKGRTARGERHRSHIHPESVPRGSRQWNSKLTEDAVREIRAEYEARENRYGLWAELGRRYGVTYTTIRRAATGAGWNHVQEDNCGLEL